MRRVWLLLCCRPTKRADQGERSTGKIFCLEEHYLYISPFILLHKTERKAQVAPAELENLVRSLDGVADCAVLGIPHPRAGQVWLITDKAMLQTSSFPGTSSSCRERARESYR